MLCEQGRKQDNLEDPDLNRYPYEFWKLPKSTALQVHHSEKIYFETPTLKYFPPTKQRSAINQAKFLATFATCSRREENRAYKVRLILLTNVWNSGAKFLSQSLNVAIAITQLVWTVIWELLYDYKQLEAFMFVHTIPVEKMSANKGRKRKTDATNGWEEKQFNFTTYFWLTQELH